MDQINLISDMKGERIDRFLSGNLEDLSRSYIQKLLKDEKILVNGGIWRTFPVLIYRSC